MTVQNIILTSKFPAYGAAIPLMRALSEPVATALMRTFVGNNSLVYTYKPLKAEVAPALAMMENMVTSIGTAETNKH